MIEAVQKFLATTPGKIAGGAVVLIAAVLMFFNLRSSFGASDAMSIANTITLTDAEAHKTFTYSLSRGDKYPIKSPLSGKMDGYPGELCYWTADGKPKTEPTYVVLNSTMGKSGATFCPDCGRLVVERNPPASAGSRPPPTQAEYRSRSAGEQ